MNGLIAEWMAPGRLDLSDAFGPMVDARLRRGASTRVKLRRAVDFKRVTFIVFFSKSIGQL